MSIKRIHARAIYDSRGNPTVEVDLWTEKGILMIRKIMKLSEIMFQIFF